MDKRAMKKIFFSNKMTVVCTCLLLLVILAALLAPLSPYDPDAVNVSEKLQGISGRHILGTDDLGRDTFTRALYGRGTVVPVIFIPAGRGRGHVRSRHRRYIYRDDQRVQGRQDRYGTYAHRGYILIGAEPFVHHCCVCVHAAQYGDAGADAGLFFLDEGGQGGTGADVVVKRT